MAFEFNNEKALDVMIWWVEGSDGSIDFREEEKVEEVLSDMNYSMTTYYEETLMHIGGLSTDNLKELVDDSIRYGSRNYSKHEKEKTVALLYAIAESNGSISEGQQEKIDRIKREFGVGDLEAWEEE
jgi:hypothetical protein